MGQQTTSGQPTSSLESLVFRIGLLSAGGVFLHLSIRLATTARLIEVPVYALLLIATGIIGLGLIGVAGCTHPPRSLQWLILLSFVGELLINGALWADHSHNKALVVIDSSIYSEFAGELVRVGQNPYQWDMSGTFDLYQTNQTANTPNLDGSITPHFSYPPLAFLLVVPFQVIGLPGAFSMLLTAHAFLLILLFGAAPPRLRPVILIPTLIGVEYTGASVSGTLEAPWVLFVAGMVLAWRKPTLRAVLYGLAIAFKQNPWFLAPFLLLRIWNENPDNESFLSRRLKLRQLLHFVGVSGATFLVINLPYILWNPVTWFEGVLNPLHSNMTYFSQGGLSGLTLFGYIYLDKSYYLMASMVVLMTLVFIYWRHFDLLSDTFLIMPGIVMWFTYRSLWSYWIYWAFPSLAWFIAHPASTVRTSLSYPKSWKRTLSVVSGAVILLITAGVLMINRQLPKAVIVPPILTTNGQINRLEVEVTNTTHDTMRPRFGVHNKDTSNPQPWLIESGPMTLQPGETGIYRIVSTGQDNLVAQDPAQLVIYDAQGRYANTRVVTLKGEPTFLWPDAIPNSRFIYWDDNQTAPIFWGLRVSPFGAGEASLIQKAGQEAVELRLNHTFPGETYVLISSSVLFPSKPFGIWVYVDDSVARAPSAQVGLEINDGQRHLWFLFVPGESTGPVPDNTVKEFAVPVNTWVFQTIDLATIYAQAGWTLPPLEQTFYRGLSADFRMIDLSLFLMGTGSQQDVRAYFGPIEQDHYRIAPETLMAETLADPAGYYARLGAGYRENHNYDRALTAYERAQEFAPSDPDISEQIEQLKLILTEASAQ